jgi:hypothetical protein
MMAIWTWEILWGEICRDERMIHRRPFVVEFDYCTQYLPYQNDNAYLRTSGTSAISA